MMQATPRSATLHLGDCLEVLPTLPENSIDAVVTDPPYGLAFERKYASRFESQVTHRPASAGLLEELERGPVDNPEEAFIDNVTASLSFDTHLSVHSVGNVVGVVDAIAARRGVPQSINTETKFQ
jgi:tRNA G10  N-methylase Trm11